MSKNIGNFLSVFLLGLLLLAAVGYHAMQSGYEKGFERERKLQLFQIERAKFMQTCIDDGGRTPEDCAGFLEGRYTKSTLYDGC